MSAWFAIIGLIAFAVGWPFVDCELRNAWKQRARKRDRVRRALDA
jgi:hypothetical protein